MDGTVWVREWEWGKGGMGDGQNIALGLNVHFVTHLEDPWAKFCLSSVDMLSHLVKQCALNT